MTVPAPSRQGRIHLLPATPATTQWGWFDNAQTPVLHIHSGDTVVMETMMHGHNQVVPGVTIDQVKKMRTDCPERGPHTLTGPVYVEEAELGDVLRVHINRIVPRAYATNFNVPGMFGEFPQAFPAGQIKFFYLDLDHNTMESLQLGAARAIRRQPRHSRTYGGYIICADLRQRRITVVRR